MQVTAKLSNLRTSPRKVRLVADLVRGKKVQEAASILSFTVNKSARPVLKLLQSAVASAKNNFHLEETNLVVSTITVDEGPKLKRWHPMSRGRAYPIIKRTSHIVLILSDKKDEKQEKLPKDKKETAPKIEKVKKPEVKKETKPKKTRAKKETKTK